MMKYVDIGPFTYPWEESSHQFWPIKLKGNVTLDKFLCFNPNVTRPLSGFKTYYNVTITNDN